MEHIRQALQRATESAVPDVKPQNKARENDPRVQSGPVSAGDAADGSQIREVELRHIQLESERIIAHDNTDPRTKSFDMLRTQILQSMDLKEWQILAVTSATPRCGKTLTAINLAMSIARQRERSVLLVDMDLQKPQISNRLSIKPERGIMSILEGNSTIAEALTRVRIGNLRLTVLPCEKSTTHSSEWMASSAMSEFLLELKRSDPSRIVILDLPPILTGDDVLLVLPQVDCVLFVAAVGTSTISEVKECNKHLQSTTVVRIALNKVSELGPAYY